MDENVPLVLTGVRVTNFLVYKFITGRIIRTCCETSRIGWDEQDRLQHEQHKLQDEQDKAARRAGTAAG